MRKTTHGAVMSPRMEALWAYIQDVRKISLSDFSTDECVRRVYPQLKAALADAPTPIVAKDLQCIMNRLPKNRIHQSSE